MSNKARMSFLRQKVKQQWLKGCDANTTYFHACLRKRRATNHIYKIKNMSGEWKDDPPNVDRAFLEFMRSCWAILMILLGMLVIVLSMRELWCLRSTRGGFV